MIITTIISLLLTQFSCGVQLMDGQSKVGKFVGLTESAVKLTTEEGSVESISLEEVFAIDVQPDQATLATSSPAGLASSMLIELQDGSRMTATKVVGTQERYEVTNSAGKWNVDPTILKSLRFRTTASAVDAQWREIAALPLNGDVLVIRKGDSLDYLEGAVESYGERVVRFRFEDDVIDVDERKLEGILFFLRSPAFDGEPRALVALRNGTMLKARQVLIDDDQMSVETICGFEARVPVRELRSLNFGAGKVVFLSDLDPEELRVVPRFGSVLQDSLDRLIYAPRKDSGFGGAPLELRYPDSGELREFSKGLALHSRTEMTWRLSGKFRRLRGTIGRAPGISMEASARLELRADGDVVFDKVITSGDAPVELDLMIENAKRLRLIVDYGDGSDISDRVHCCDLRVIK